MALVGTRRLGLSLRICAWCLVASAISRTVPKGVELLTGLSLNASGCGSRVTRYLARGFWTWASLNSVLSAPSGSSFLTNGQGRELITAA